MNHKNFFRLSRQVAITAIAQSTTRQKLVNEEGQLTQFGRSLLAETLERNESDRAAISAFIKVLSKENVNENTINTITDILKSMLTSPSSLFGQITFSSLEDRAEALQSLLLFDHPKKVFALDLKRPIEYPGHANTLLSVAEKAGVILPASVKGNVLYIKGGIGSAGAKEYPPIERDNPRVSIYEGSFSHLLADLLEGLKSDPSKAQQEVKQDAKETIEEIKQDPDLDKKEKQSLIQKFIQELASIFKRFFGIPSTQPHQETKTTTPTTPTPPTTPTTPTTQEPETKASLGLLITNRLYKIAEKVAKPSLKNAISMYLKDLKYAISNRINPSEIEILLGSTLEPAGTLQDILSKGFTLPASSSTQSDNLNFQIVFKHPLFKQMPELGIFKRLAKKVAETYPDIIASYRESKEGDLIYIIFTVYREVLTDISPTRPRASQFYSATEQRLEQIYRKDIRDLFKRLMKFLPAVKSRLDSIKSKDINTEKILRIIRAFELYRALYSRSKSEKLIGDEISKELELLSDSLQPSSSPDDLLNDLIIFADTLETMPGLSKLLKSMPESTSSKEDIEKIVSKTFKGDLEKKYPEGQIVISPRKVKKDILKQKIVDLVSRINTLKRDHPDNKILLDVIQEIEQKLKAMEKGEYEFSKDEIEEYNQLLPNLLYL